MENMRGAPNAFSQPFHLDGQVTVSLFTLTVGGVAASGRLCATLIDHAVSGGVPNDRVLGQATYDLGAWPRSARRVTFTFQGPRTKICRPGTA